MKNLIECMKLVLDELRISEDEYVTIANIQKAIDIYLPLVKHMERSKQDNKILDFLVLQELGKQRAKIEETISYLESSLKSEIERDYWGNGLQEIVKMLERSAVVKERLSLLINRSVEAQAYRMKFKNREVSD